MKTNLGKWAWACYGVVDTIETDYHYRLWHVMEVSTPKTKETEELEAVI